MRKFVSLVLCMFMIVGVMGLAGCVVNDKSEDTPADTEDRQEDEGTKDESKDEGKEEETKDEEAYSFDPDTKATVKIYAPKFNITRLHWDPEGTEEFTEFYKMYPNITIDKTVLGGSDIKEKVLTEAASGVYPDVYTLASGDIPSFVAQEQLYCVDEYIKNDPDSVSNLVDGILKLVTFQGKKWGLPCSQRPCVLFYNKDLLDKIGEPYPEEGMSRDDFIDLIKRLTKHEPGNTYIGMNMMDLRGSMFFGMFDAKPVTKQGDKWVVDIQNDSNSIEMIETIVDLATKYKLMFSEDELAAGLEDDWRKGSVVFGYGGPWMTKTDIRYGTIMPIESPSGFRGVENEGETYHIHPGSEVKDAAWEVVKYLNSDSCQIDGRYWIQAPGANDWGRDKFYSAVASTKAHYERTDLPENLTGILDTFMDAAKYYVPIDEYPVDFCAEQMISIAEAVITGEKDMATAIKDVELNIDEVLNAGK